MVERLKVAVAKARAKRARAATGGEPDPARPSPPARPLPPAEPPAADLAAADPAAAEPAAAEPGPAAAPASTRSDRADALWRALEPVELDAAHLERNRIVTHARVEKAHVAFDVLRTRILRVFRKHGWTRLGITSPSRGCGKTFVASNLALSLAHHQDCRTMLLDLDLRLPGLSKVLGVRDLEPVEWLLTADVAPEHFLRRIGSNLAVGLSATRTRDPAETLLAPQATEALADMNARFAPDIVIYDLPPILAVDDVLGFLPQLDCVLLVVGGGTTRPSEVTECERLLADQTHLLGVLMNKAEDARSSEYGYGTP